MPIRRYKIHFRGFVFVGTTVLVADAVLLNIPHGLWLMIPVALINGWLWGVFYKIPPIEPMPITWDELVDCFWYFRMRYRRWSWRIESYSALEESCMRNDDWGPYEEMWASQHWRE